MKNISNLFNDNAAPYRLRFALPEITHSATNMNLLNQRRLGRRRSHAFAKGDMVPSARGARNGIARLRTQLIQRSGRPKAIELNFGVKSHQFIEFAYENTVFNDQTWNPSNHRKRVTIIRAVQAILPSQKLAATDG